MTGEGETTWIKIGGEKHDCAPSPRASLMASKPCERVCPGAGDGEGGQGAPHSLLITWIGAVRTIKRSKTPNGLRYWRWGGRRNAVRAEK
jgi:hypothetical protein